MAKHKTPIRERGPDMEANTATIEADTIDDPKNSAGFRSITPPGPKPPATLLSGSGSSSPIQTVIPRGPKREAFSKVTRSRSNHVRSRLTGRTGKVPETGRPPAWAYGFSEIEEEALMTGIAGDSRAQPMSAFTCGHCVTVLFGSGEGTHRWPVRSHPSARSPT